MSGCNGRRSPEFSPEFSNAQSARWLSLVDRKEPVRAKAQFHPQRRRVMLSFNPTTSSL